MQEDLVFGVSLLNRPWQTHGNCILRRDEPVPSAAKPSLDGTLFQKHPMYRTDKHSRSLMQPMPVCFTSLLAFLHGATGTKEQPEWLLDLASHNPGADVNS